MNDIPTVDDLAMFATWLNFAFGQCHQKRVADEQIETIVEQTNAQHVDVENNKSANPTEDQPHGNAIARRLMFLHSLARKHVMSWWS
jgi:hypothetical protein